MYDVVHVSFFDVHALGVHPVPWLASITITSREQWRRLQNYSNSNTKNTMSYAVRINTGTAQYKMTMTLPVLVDWKYEQKSKK